MNRRPLRLDPGLVAAALLALIPGLAILGPGMPQTADGYVHLLRVAEVGRLWEAGVLYPRWAPDFYLGYGYPFFNFYSPGAHMAASLFAAAGLGPGGGMVAVQLLAILLYSTGAYLFARSLLAPYVGWQGALLCAALYLYAPLRYRELFFQANFSQFVALSLLPWCAWFLTEAVLRRSLRWAAAAAVAVAALVYVHAPSAYVSLPSLAVFALLLALVAGDFWRRLGLAAGAMLLGLALSAPFWLPALSEFGYVNIKSISSGMFTAQLHLVPLKELLAPAQLLDEASINPTFPRALGTVQVLLTLAGLGVALYWAVRGAGGEEQEPAGLNQRQLGALLLGVGGLLLVTVALVLPAAGPLWDVLPLGSIIAFPWRLLGPALLWTALLGGAALALAPRRYRTAALAAGLVLVPLSVATYLFPRPFAPTGDAGLTGLARYELSGGARATASANEYLPAWVIDKDPPNALALEMQTGVSPDRLDSQALPQGSRTEVIQAGPPSYTYRLTLPQDARIRFRQFYFPGWRAWIDGAPAEIVPDGRYGLIELDVPAGEHELRLEFGPTPPRVAGGLLALGGVLAIVTASWAEGRKGGMATSVRRGELAHWKSVLPAGALILALTGMKVLVVEPHTRWFRAMSPVEAPAAMQHAVHAQFANGMELLGYDVSDSAVRQGNDLGVRLYWRATRPQEERTHPFLQLDSTDGVATWTYDSKVHPADVPTTKWPVGFYVVDDYILEIGSGTPPVMSSLRAGLLDSADHRVPLAAGGDIALLGPVWVTDQQPPLALTLPGRTQSYRLGDNIELVGHTAAIEGDPAEIHVTLYWRASGPVPEDYTVFLHVLDASDAIIAQADSPPLGGRYPTSAWLSGQIITDEYHIPLPAGTDSESLRIATGLYRRSDMTRLTVTDRRGAAVPDNRIVFTPEPPLLTLPAGRASPARP